MISELICHWAVMTKLHKRIYTETDIFILQCSYLPLVRKVRAGQEVAPIKFNYSIISTSYMLTLGSSWLKVLLWQDLNAL